MLEEVLQAKRHVLGDGHPSTLASIRILPELRQEQDRPDEAVALLEEATRPLQLDDGYDASVSRYDSWRSSCSESQSARTSFRDSYRSSHGKAHPEPESPRTEPESPPVYARQWTVSDEY